METATLGHNLFCLKDLALTPRTHILLSVLALKIRNSFKNIFSSLAHYLEQTHISIMKDGFRLVAVLHCIAVLSKGFR